MIVVSALEAVDQSWRQSRRVLSLLATAETLKEGLRKAFPRLTIEAHHRYNKGADTGRATGP